MRLQKPLAMLGRLRRSLGACPKEPAAGGQQFASKLLHAVELLKEENRAQADRIVEALESIRHHTWLDKEFAGLYFEDMLLEAELRRHGPRFVAKYNAHLFSQSYEDSAIAEIFSRIGIGSRRFVEIGAGDGNENTTRLLLSTGWSGLWIEGDNELVGKIQSRFAAEIEQGRLLVRGAMLTVDAVADIVQPCIQGDVDFLSIDIDLHTSHIWRALPLRPRAACIEYNAHFHPSIEYEVTYTTGAIWDGSNLFGASLKTLEKIGRSKGMSLVGCDLMGINAYFVAEELLGDHFSGPYTAEHHYQPPRYQFVRGQRGHRRANR